MKSIVNFYSLQKTDDIYLCICQLVKDLYKKDKNILIIDNDDKLESIDKLLWSFEQNSFLPHKILSQDNDFDTPILLISSHNIRTLKSDQNYTEIINNCEIPLIENNTYTNIHEFISDNEEHKRICRNKYTQYANNNFDVKHSKYNEKTV